MSFLKITVSCPMCNTPYTLEFGNNVFDDNNDDIKNIKNIKNTIEKLYCYSEKRYDCQCCETSVYIANDGEKHFPCCCNTHQI